MNIFFRPEEAMFENWQKLVSTEKIFILFLRISILHVKTGFEKYKHIGISIILCLALSEIMLLGKQTFANNVRVSFIDGHSQK